MHTIRLKLNLNRLAIVLFLVSGIVNMTDQMKQFQIPLLFAGTLLSLPGVLKTGRLLLSRSQRVMLLLALGSMVSGLCSAALLHEPALLADTAALLAVLLVFVVIMPGARDFPSDISGIMLFLFFVCEALSLLARPITLSNYKGFLYNVNSFGDLFCSFFAFFLAASLNVRGGKRKLLLTVCALISLFNVVISSSRGAFVSAALAALLWILFRLKLQGKLTTRFTAGVIAACVLIALILVFTPVTSIIQHSIIEKFQRKSSNFSANRFEIWSIVWKERTLFGHGRNYFSGYRGKIRFGAHNTFVSLLGQYGVIGAVPYLLLCAVFFFMALRCAKKRGEYAPLIFVLQFVVMSMIEGMLMKASMFLMYYGVGLCIYRLRRKSENTETAGAKPFSPAKPCGTIGGNGGVNHQQTI